MHERGRRLLVSAWVKEGDDGKFFSLALTPKITAPATKSKSRAERQILDDEVPF
jgi:hypothetical protein